ncbi:MAG: hypothetical protein WCD76_10230 [Pyrinomonadaceae bacterium]
MTLRRPVILLVALLAVASCYPAALAIKESPCNRGETIAAEVVGTWTGESLCAGHRPACKNEEVVYRFTRVSMRDDLVTLYADKVLNMKRVPMYKLDFVYDADKGTLSSEFTRGQTHGLWRYQFEGDVLEGTLMLLAGKEVGRRVRVHRVAGDQLPEAPSLDEYESRVGRDADFIQRAE